MSESKPTAAKSDRTANYLANRLPISIRVSPGELADRMSILQLKLDHLAADNPQRPMLQAELDAVKHSFDNAVAGNADLRRSLENNRDEFNVYRLHLDAVNANLWSTEDEVRAHEHRGLFQHAFIKAARAVYKLNDQRATIKRQINALFGAADEVKIYPTHSPEDESAQSTR